jgi:hypothetical protein
MSETNNAPKIEVSLCDGVQDGECVKIAFNGGCDVAMTPQQARALASELIQLVYKAEVKTSLQRGKRPATASERVVQGSFPGPRVAGAQ